MEEKAAITDSPWFWVLVFSGMALLALLVIGPKYGQRQARIELQYQARERIAADRAAGNNPVVAERTDGQAERREFASPGDTLIPLWPLAMLLAIVVIFSLVMLVRGRVSFATGTRWHLVEQSVAKETRSHPDS